MSSGKLQSKRSDYALKTSEQGSGAALRVNVVPQHYLLACVVGETHEERKQKSNCVRSRHPPAPHRARSEFQLEWSLGADRI